MRRLRLASIVAGMSLTLACGNRAPRGVPDISGAVAASPEVDSRGPSPDVKGAGGASPAPSAPSLSIDITMSAGTANELARQGYSIYGLEAVRASSQAGTPLLWFRVQAYSTQTTIEWREAYQAYAGIHTAPPPVAVDALSAQDIGLGQTFHVQHSTGTGVVTADGLAGAISIINQTSTPFTSGISQKYGETGTRLWAFPLDGLQSLTIAPVAKVLLMMASAALKPGTAVQTSPGPGILIDMSGSRRRAVAYELNAGWSWDNSPWAQVVPVATELKPLLLQPDLVPLGRAGVTPDAVRRRVQQGKRGGAVRVPATSRDEAIARPPER